MRRFLSALAALLLAASPALAADPIDLSGMSFDDLVALREQINLAIWNSQEWQEVTVPAGTWEIGKDIPAGHWTIKPANDFVCSIYYCSELDELGHSAKFSFDGYLTENLVRPTSAYFNGGISEIDLVMEPGHYFINDIDAIFCPYIGKPDLGFH